MSNLIYLLALVVPCGILAGVLVFIVKKGNAKFDVMFATLSEMDKERIKNTDYKTYEENPEWFVAEAQLTEVTKVMNDKVKISVIFYNNVRQHFSADSPVVDKAVFEERGMKVGDPIKVILKDKEGFLVVHGVL